MLLELFYGITIFVCIMFLHLCLGTALYYFWSDPSVDVGFSPRIYTMFVIGCVPAMIIGLVVFILTYIYYGIKRISWRSFRKQK